MAELVGSALLSGFFNVLLDRMATQEVLNFFRGKKVLAKLLDELKIRLLSANKLMNDAEVKQLTDENVKKWLDDLKQVLYEADHAMDEINTEALRRKVEAGDQSGSRASKFINSISTFFGAFENTVRSEIEDILSRLKSLSDQALFLGLKEGDQKRLLRRLPAPWAEESDVYGREKDKEKIIEVGTEECDVFEVTKALFGKTSKRNSDTKDLYDLQEELKKFLMAKKFLYVLDDVWNEDYQFWELLQSPLKSDAQGSRVIVTTRSMIVASKIRNVRAYDLKTLSNDDCLHLFRKHVSDNTESSVVADSQEIGIEIVERCKGVPLAVKSIAGVLRSTHPEEWGLILRSDIWQLKFQENHNPKILPALCLSYHFLPAHLKRCFAYLSIFPKDYPFRESDTDYIIWLWMAEGLLQPQEGKRMEDIGVEYLNALKARSYFQQSSWDKSTLVMHDLIHDLAVSVSGEFCHLSDGCNDHSCNLMNKTGHFSYGKKSTDLRELEGLSKLKCLRTFLALPYSKVTQSILHELLLRAGGCLRVLSLAESYINELPDSIGNLKHLRYLDLSQSKVKEIPSSICTLYNLQTLLLLNCVEITQLPTSMCCLINLRHLVIKGTPLKEMPPQMCKLKNLQTLSDFVLGKNGGSRIKELGELQCLRGSLCISGLENVVDVGDVKQADLKNKEHLSELILEWEYGEIDDSTKERQVLDALKPHGKLKKLEIRGYRGTIFPDWVAHKSFSDLVEVFLIHCERCCLLPSFGQLPSLRKLRIEYMNGLESIGDDFYGTSLTKPFPSLESLIICNMDLLENWSFAGVEQGGELFPRLEDIFFRSCKKLKVGLPAGCFPSLERIEIGKCVEMVSVFPISQVEIDSACPSLKLISLVVCPRLESFSTMGLPSNLKALLINSCPILNYWDLQRLSSLQCLWLDGCQFEEAVDSFPEEGLLPSTLTSLIICDFRNLKALNGKGFQQLTSLQQLDISNCIELESLPEKGIPRSLTCLFILNCPLLNERCKRGTGEDWPKIQHIPNITINLEKV
ncbi:putative disease resistance RPP13-like protein 1 [Morus notabilis]|uniref:putative disease resistance RPP13-like protein 1 n=1 Tax=Morus notabilis TaxID=981085 RepID=UPI000CED1D5E|nr:putative disease resistance RPP13-like protein 1 [Morus notabilis]